MEDIDSKNRLIRLFVRHHNAANLLLICMCLFGLFGLSSLNTQFFPTLEVKEVSVSIPWPGASAQDVDKNIVETLQPELRFLDGLKELTSTARNGFASLRLSFQSNVNMQKAKSDVEAAVGQVTTLPKDSERPIVSQNTFYEPVASILVTGPFSEQVIRTHAKAIRDGLLDAGIDRVTFKGMRDEEIWVEAHPDNLRRYDLTIGMIANSIQRSSLDVPGGVLRGDIEKQVRAVGLALTAAEVEDIELRTDPDGSRLLIKDVALVTDTFAADAPTGWVGDKRAISLTVMRTKTTDALLANERIETYINKIKPALPPNLEVQVYDVLSDKINQRISVLVNNGAGGLILVLVILFLFLNARIAFWVAVGIPVSMLATFGFMWVMGISINMLSLFALIMTVGIIVDDAIVVGEHAETLSRQGLRPRDAAQMGAQRMLAPIIAASSTTVAAFLPILMVKGEFGDIVRDIPIVLCAVLLASLAECFLILPGHLRHALRKNIDQAQAEPPEQIPEQQNEGHVYIIEAGETKEILLHPRNQTAKKRNAFTRWQEGFYTRFEHFRDHKFRNFIGLAYDYRYTSLSVAVSFFMVCMMLLSSGHVSFRFFPSPEGEIVRAFTFFQPGTPRAQTHAGLRQIEASLYATENQLTNGAGGLIKTVFTTVGSTSFSNGDDRGVVWVELAASEDRDIRTETFIKTWEDNLPELANLRNIYVRERRGGPPSSDIDIQLQGRDPLILKQAAIELADALKAYPGVNRPRDNLFYAKRELVLEVNARGAALGFDNQMVGSAARNNLEGAISKRFARADEEVTVRVLQPRQAAAPRQLEDIDLPVPNTNPVRYVPLSSVVDILERPGFSTIRRIDGKITTSITADFKSDAGNPNDVLADLEKNFLPALAAKYNIEFSFGGRNKDQRESFEDLGTGAMMGLAIIYIILAFVFASYSLPVIIMSVIPFGFVGTIIGHYVQNFDLTFLSLIGLLGLSGIIVNNSIILISRIQERLSSGEPHREAIINGVVDRFRAVLLTSSTTVMGLAPLLFETSMQAQFLLPMVITMAWGLAVSSLIVLVLVPSLLGVRNDIQTQFGKSASAPLTTPELR